MLIDVTKYRAFVLSPDKEQYKARREHSMRQIAKYGIAVEWFKAIPHENGRKSASISVQALLAATGDEPILFFEDDVTSWNPNTVFEVPDECDILRLGNSVGIRANESNPGDPRNAHPLRRVNDQVY